MLKGECQVQQQLRSAVSLNVILSNQHLANCFVAAEIMPSGDDDCYGVL